MIFGTFNAMLFALGLILCGLNVMGFIHISWVLATLPFWGGVALDFIILIIFLIIKICNHEFDEAGSN